MDGRRWVPRLKTGDPEAYEMLYHAWFPEAYRTAYLITHDRQLAEDAVQDAFANILQRIGTLRNPEGLRSWLHVVVSRTAVDVVRRRAAQRATPVEEIFDLTDVADGAAWAPPGPPTPEEAALANLRSQEVLAALSDLPPHYRQVVVLFYYHQLTIPEIARALGCPEGTVKSRLFRARAHLAAVLQAEGRDHSAPSSI